MSVDDYIERFRARVLQDALLEALPSYWLHRAEQFEWAKSQEGDFIPDPDAQREADERLDALALECRERASRREALGEDWWRPLIEEALRDAEQGP